MVGRLFQPPLAERVVRVGKLTRIRLPQAHSVVLSGAWLVAIASARAFAAVKLGHELINLTSYEAVLTMQPYQAGPIARYVVAL